MRFLEDTYRLINKYNQKAKTAKRYGTEDLLYSAEIHMIYVQSMGTELGMKLYKQLSNEEIKVHSLFFDGAPMIRLSRA